ncbi:MAG: taurine catabolism dioxygenase TauD [Gammaproteobacteria bacterium]|nr:taurine catabolism dioxygenase TauD [Gammaproteobacteria bacterium]
MAYKLEPLERSFGAVITEINLVNIQDSDFDSLYSDWLKYALLIFPQQHLTNEEQINFAKRFGEMEYDISELSNVKKDGSVRDPNNDDYVKMLKGNIEWHHDSTYMPIQAKGSVFTAHTVPSSGGETGWVDCRASYAALENEMKEKLKNLNAYHSYEYSQKERYGHKSKEESEFSGYGFDVDPKPLRPLVKTHPETGIKCLTIGRHIYKIPGMEDDEARSLAKELEEFSLSNQEWIYHHNWKKGDAVIWDNRCLMHQACPWNYEEPRIMFHSRIAGDKSSELALNH